MSTTDDILERYEELLFPIHLSQQAMWKTITEPIMKAACQSLGVANGGKFTPKDPESVITVMNYALFNVFEFTGQNLAEMWAAKTTPTDDDHALVIQAHLRSFFSIFHVVEILPQLGAKLCDIFTEETYQVVYPHLTEVLKVGLVVRIRLMPLPDFHVHFNGPLAVAQPIDLDGFTQSMHALYIKAGAPKGVPLTPHQRHKIETVETIETLAQVYPELSLLGRRQQSQPVSPEPQARGMGQRISGAATAGRNEPCPCGSGKKFKQCCLQRN